ADDKPRSATPAHVPYTTLFRSPAVENGGPHDPVPHLLRRAELGNGPLLALLLRKALEPVIPGAFTEVRLQLLPDGGGLGLREPQDRKSTRLNSSHVKISYADFC